MSFPSRRVSRRLLDVGGGSAGVSIGLALRYPQLHCTVLDRPAVCSCATTRIQQYSLHERVDTWAADAFADPWPTGYDAVLFNNFCNCFDRPRCEALLAKAFGCLSATGQLYIHEMLLADGKGGPLGVAALSLYDHQGSRGQQWSAGEVTDLCERAGFVRTDVTPTYGYAALITAYTP